MSHCRMEPIFHFPLLVIGDWKARRRINCATLRSMRMVCVGRILTKIFLSRAYCVVTMANM